MKRMLPSAWRCCSESFWRTGKNENPPAMLYSTVICVAYSFLTQQTCLPLFVSRDRVSCVWQTVRDHLCHLCVHANENCFLVERAVVGLLRLAIRLLRREDISSQVHQTHTHWHVWTQTLQHSWYDVTGWDNRLWSEDLNQNSWLVLVHSHVSCWCPWPAHWLF